MAAGSPAEYSSHHIQNLTFGQHADGSWGFAHSAKEAAEMGFIAINADTMFWSLLTPHQSSLSFQNAVMLVQSTTDIFGMGLGPSLTACK